MIVGIDLGTTNSTLSTSDGPQMIRQQLGPDWEGEHLALPSFCFFPPDGGEIVVGAYAKERGSQIPDRVVHSAKSWLSYDRINRRSPFLPVGECEVKISPVDACARYLSHLTQGLSSIDSLVVTVPASFDPSARQLVEEACDLAGLPARVLLEEPLAAFYAWLKKHEGTWRNQLKVGDTVLVIDIGGGTTDFSLIRVTERDGTVELERVAVGDHLLLGGDNMDLALAYHLAGDRPLDAWQMGALVHSCRSAKEQLLGPGGPESVEVVIPGRGSSLIGGAISFTLTRQQVHNLIIDGFFPLVSFDLPTLHHPRVGLTHDSLPYARDPRITAHLAHFLHDHPTAVLFNGGVLHAEGIRHQILEQLHMWKGERVIELSGADYDLGVSLGAVAYAEVCRGKGIRVRAPIPHSYYIGVEKAIPAIPGLLPPIEGVYIVPKGMEEGSEVTLKRSFSLIVGEPVLFRFFASHDQASLGDHLSIAHLTELHPIETTLDGEGVISVNITAKVTELGVLELWCLSEDGQRWKLSFEVREQLSLVSS